MVKTREDWKIVNWVFDKSTLNTLEKIKKQGYELSLISPISLGKEASVFLGKLYDDYVAIKIYAIESRIFKRMYSYIDGDPRFPRMSKRPRVLIKFWVKKEYLNLFKAWDLGINVPKPITFKNNVLVMEFLGKGNSPAPKLRDVNLDEKEAKKVLDKILNWVEIYWKDGLLVHGDLSEWNVLMLDEDPYLIDFSLGVMKYHPLSLQLLKRDIHNIINYFNRKYGFDYNPSDIFKEILKKTWKE